MNTLGNNIARLLEERGMSQRELADKVGTTEVSMSRYIKGTRTPKGPLISKMARVLGTDPNTILKDTELEYEVEVLPNTEAMQINEEFDSSEEYYCVTGIDKDGKEFLLMYDSAQTIGFNIWSLLRTFKDCSLTVRRATEQEVEAFKVGP